MDGSTLVCFSMLTDLIDAASAREGGRAANKLYLGQLETCTRPRHEGVVQRGDEVSDGPYLEEVLRRDPRATIY